METPNSRPFTGAWIETNVANTSCKTVMGRPFTGAWIETTTTLGARLRQTSPLHGGVD